MLPLYILHYVEVFQQSESCRTVLTRQGSGLGGTADCTRQAGAQSETTAEGVPRQAIELFALSVHD